MININSKKIIARNRDWEGYALWLEKAENHITKATDRKTAYELMNDDNQSGILHNIGMTPKQYARFILINKRSNDYMNSLNYENTV